MDHGKLIMNFLSLKVFVWSKKLFQIFITMVGAIREEELIEIDDAKRKTAEAVFESYQLEAQLQKNTS